MKSTENLDHTNLISIFRGYYDAKIANKMTAGKPVSFALILLQKQMLKILQFHSEIQR